MHCLLTLHHISCLSLCSWTVCHYLILTYNHWFVLWLKVSYFVLELYILCGYLNQFIYYSLKFVAPPLSVAYYLVLYIFNLMVVLCYRLIIKLFFSKSFSSALNLLISFVTSISGALNRVFLWFFWFNLCQSV